MQTRLVASTIVQAPTDSNAAITTKHDNDNDNMIATATTVIEAVIPATILLCLPP
ncbi:hypothetical protein QBC45DRAFT_402112 [Copromyces sp. CBS 386.78]|nr:hypothetical protein QBC45DRAFT_402112 [Copromyces sp. CBS 386.78]